MALEEISIKRLKKQFEADESVTYKVKWEDTLKFNGVKLVDHKKGFFKCQVDDLKTILDVEEKIVNLLTEKNTKSNIYESFVSSIIVTKEYGQVFRYKRIENPNGLYNIMLNLRKIKMDKESIKLCWECIHISPNSSSDIELYDEYDCQEDPEPDPEILQQQRLETIKQELLEKIDMARKCYIEKLDGKLSQISNTVNNMTISDISNIKSIEEALDAL